jgi:outer membrane protein assembly factor BamD
MSQRVVFRSPLLIVFVGLVGTLLAGCADEEKDVYKERPVEQIYNDGMDFLADQSFGKAAKAFDDVERQHPYSVWATKAELMAAFAYYQDNHYDDAINELERYILLHPGNKDAPYAYYLKAICYYERIGDVARDQKVTEDALKALQQVVDRFPASRYAADAKLKEDLARDHIAGKEMTIGRWYQSQHMYLAAINRYRTVIDNYQTTTHVPEALERLDECYESLGLKNEATKAAAVLGYNYPGNPWYADAYGLVKGLKGQPDQQDSGWFDWLW